MIGAIAEKEFRDNLTSKRFFVVFGFLLAVVVLSLILVKLDLYGMYMPGGDDEAPKVYHVLWGVNYLIGSVGGIFALALGFDAVTKEKENRTMNVLMGHPVFRDQVILGKILGGAITLAVSVLITALIMTGLLLWIGVTIDSYARMVMYFLVMYLYFMVFFTMGVAFSAHSSSSGSALMYALVAFLILTTLTLPVAELVAYGVAGPRPQEPEELRAYYEEMERIFSSENVTPEDMAKMEDIQKKMEVLQEEYSQKIEEWSKKYWKTIEYVQIISPEYDFDQVSEYVLNPEKGSEDWFVYYDRDFDEEEPPSYSLSESLSFVKKELGMMVAYLVLWTVIAYLGFVRAEIR